MLEYARWKYILVSVVLAAAFFLALPNVFGESEALQVARRDRAAIEPAQQAEIETFLKARGVVYNKIYTDAGNVMVHFDAVSEQLKARDAVNDGLKEQYVTALSFASNAPLWLREVGLRPMPL